MLARKLNDSDETGTPRSRRCTAVASCANLSPATSLPAGQNVAAGGLPDHPRRAEPRRQPGAQPRPASHTWMEPEADKLMAESLSRNFVDAGRVPPDHGNPQPLCQHAGTAVQRPDDGAAGRLRHGRLVGGDTSCRLSAQMALAGARQAAGLPIGNPNIVMGGTSKFVGRNSPATSTSNRAMCPWQPTGTISRRRGDAACR